MSDPLVVVGYGALTAVGWNAAQTCAAVRAAVTGFAESDFFQDTPEPEPLIAARAPDPVPAAGGGDFERLVGLASPALRECLEAGGLDPSKTPLFLALREPYREHPDLDGRGDDLLRAIGAALGSRLHPASAVVPEGNAAAFRGLVRARTLLGSGAAGACVVGGVDSYLNAPDLARFEGAFRLKREGVAQGFIPGEGAAFVAVASPASARGLTALAEVVGVGLADEDPDLTVVRHGHPTGRGLKRALAAAVADAGLPESGIAFRVSDMNGETYRGFESMFVVGRFYKTRREKIDTWLPASCVGETGAAVGPLLVILAAVGLNKGYAPGPLAMCEASSDTGLRGACLVRPPRGVPDGR